jgi:hypothetical protein
LVVAVAVVRAPQVARLAGLLQPTQVAVAVVRVLQQVGNPVAVVEQVAGSMASSLHPFW